MATWAFTGSRDFTDRALVERVIRRLVKRHHGPGMVIRVGDAKRGLDPMVAHESTRWGIWPDVQKCHWPPNPSTKQERWMAAHERNGRVVLGENRDDPAVGLVAFFAPGERSPGTSDCIDQARAVGVPVYIYQEGRWELPQAA